MGLLIASIGVFGLVAYEVSLRTREIGIRMALGAQRRGIIRLTLAQGVRPVLIGLVIGIIGAFGAGLVLRSILVGVAPADPTTLVAVSTVLLGSTAVAVLGPVVRALSIDAARVLRDE